jgi:hypothetical protein
MARLARENAKLRAQLESIPTRAMTYNGLSFDEMYSLLARTKVDVGALGAHNASRLRELAAIFGDSEPGLLHVFWELRIGLLRRGSIDLDNTADMELLAKLEEYGLVEEDKTQLSPLKKYYGLTASGTQFLLRLRLERDSERAEPYVV